MAASDERRKPSSAITFPYKYANMAARCTALGREGVRDDSRGERERERENARLKERDGGVLGPLGGRGRARAQGGKGGLGSLSLRKNRESRGNNY